MTAKRTLRKLRKLNKIISIRLALHDQLPDSFQTYHVHDGRVTFHVPGEFELDLSVGDENKSSQFFFVDIRFLFSPSSPIPKGRLLNELDLKVNDVLRDRGLVGCFEYLHNLVLTNKVQALFKQSSGLARGLWSGVLHTELLHRTLVVQYWASKPGTKSWLEIGIRSGHQSGNKPGREPPCLGLRWIRDGQEVDSNNVHFDTQNLSMESVLRTVIAQHISHILASAYAILNENSLFSSRKLSLHARLSTFESSDCQLDTQLTWSRSLRASIEPMSGAIILSSTPSMLERPESDRPLDKASVDDIVSRISRLRCIGAIEEIESNLKMLAFEIVNPRALRLEVRKLFPSNVLRFSLFTHPTWSRNWILAATSSMDSDNWWFVQFRSADSSIQRKLPGDTNTDSTSVFRSAQMVSSAFQSPRQPFDYSSFADLGHCLSGTLAIYANARYLSQLQRIDFSPPLQRLQIEPSLQVPDLFIRYDPVNLHPSLRLAMPAGLKKKSFIKDTVRLALHGIDPAKGVAIMVAYGNLTRPAKTPAGLISRSDDSLVFQQNGSGFALRLLAPVGGAVAINLIETLQKLECVLSIFESIQQRRMTLQSLSLARVAFTYSPDRNLSAVIHAEIPELSTTENIDPLDVVSKIRPLFRLRLAISFSDSAPHRRIQESLTAILNDESSDRGFDVAMKLLPLTLPLLRALDQLSANSSHKGLLKSQVTVRSPKSFYLRYPVHKFRFQILAIHNSGRVIWILRDVSGTQDRSNQAQLVTNLQDSLYNTRGDGWRGLGNGVISDIDKVGNLLFELDKCFPAAQADSIAKLTEERKRQPTSASYVKGPDSSAKPSAPTAPTSNEPKQEAGDLKNADVITID